jgi:uncharacterized protein (TIGR03790 family)
MSRPAYAARKVTAVGCIFAVLLGLARAEEGSQVAVVFNRQMPGSHDLAIYYAGVRSVPTNQVFGFDLPTTETISRTDFRELLQKPLFEALKKGELLTVKSEAAVVGSGAAGAMVSGVAGARIRYVVLCYGVPVRILKDPSLTEPDMDKVPETLRRNEAAVDSELALLPSLPLQPRITGPAVNPLYGVTNAALLHPTNGILLVARLDGPSVEIARGLVDKARAAETNGLWGRAYFDLRGLTNGNYRLGEQWIRGAAEICRRTGFETILDEKPETFPASFPMSHIAFYAGWYDAQVSGPFTRPEVEFMPGAVAYHLHSFSAQVLRSASQHWVGPLLAKGATATMGCVDEPYLEGTPDLAVFWSRFIPSGFSFGEAAYAGQQTLSWQTTVVGDPLYRPFGRANPEASLGARFQELHTRLLASKSPWIEWSHLQVANLNLVGNFPVNEVIDYLEDQPGAQRCAVLQEKLGDIFYANGKLLDALRAYERALPPATSPMQRLRLRLTLARMLALLSREAEALDQYRELLKEFPGYPAVLEVYQRMLPLARSLNRTADLEHIQSEIQRLTPPPAR